MDADRSRPTEAIDFATELWQAASDFPDATYTAAQKLRGIRSKVREYGDLSSPEPMSSTSMLKWPVK